MRKLVVVAPLSVTLIGLAPVSPATATVPALNGWIAGAYVHDVVLVEPASGVRLELLTGGAEEEGISWSPSGDKLAIISGLELLVVDPGTGGSQVLVENGCVGGRTSWNPDGTTILYHDCSGIAMINADGTAPSEPLSLTGMFHPEWSPDGEWIAVARHSDGDYDIWKVRSDGSEATQLTDLPGDQVWPTWSPDGGWIAFEDQQAGTDVSKVTSAGGTPIELTTTPGYDGGPNWSPDGQSIAFSSSRAPGVFTMDVDGSDQVRVPNSIPVSYVAWQPAQLVLRPSARTVLGGSTVRLDIELRWVGTEVPAVQIQRKTNSTGWTQIGSVTLGAEGTASFTTRVKQHSRFRAVWAGDSGHPSARSLPAFVRARAEVSGHLFRHHARSGQWFLYHVGRRVWYAGDVDPTIEGRLCFRLQRRRSGTWRGPAAACFQVGPNGGVAVYMVDLPLGFVGRIRAYFRATNALDGNRADWAYFRVTR